MAVQKLGGCNAGGNLPLAIRDPDASGRKHPGRELPVCSTQSCFFQRWTVRRPCNFQTGLDRRGAVNRGLGGSPGGLRELVPRGWFAVNQGQPLALVLLSLHTERVGRDKLSLESL